MLLCLWLYYDAGCTALLDRLPCNHVLVALLLKCVQGGASPGGLVATVFAGCRPAASPVSDVRVPCELHTAFTAGFHSLRLIAIKCMPLHAQALFLCSAATACMSGQLCLLASAHRLL